MDLSQFDLSTTAAAAAVMTVQNPITSEDMYDADGNPVTITLLGMESDVAKRVTKARAQKQLNQRKQKIDIDEARAFTISLQCKLIVASSGLSDNGTPLDMTNPQVAQEVLTKYSWLREQIDEFVTDRSNFYKG